MSKRTVVGGAAVLGIAALLGKILGAVYRIPLQNFLLADGMAYFQVAYPIYALMMVMCTTGLPAALSRMVAQRKAIGDKRGAQEVFYYSAATFAIFGAAVSLLIWISGGAIANFAGLPLAEQSVKAMAPLVFLCMAISAFRGYYQGLQMMASTAISQLIEQVIKIALGLLLAARWMAISTERAAMGAVIGVVVGELAALAYMLVIYALGLDQTRVQFASQMQDYEPISPAKMIGMIWANGISITVGASLIPLSILADTLYIVPTLTKSGYALEISRDSFGLYSGVALPLALIPGALLVGVALASIPELASYLELKQMTKLKKTTMFSLKITQLISIPCAVGLYILAKPIIVMLFSKTMIPAEIDLTTQILKMLCFGIPFFSLAQTTCAILQSIGKAAIPVITTLFGIAMKVSLNAILTPMHSINILGPAFATVITISAVSVINTAYVVHMTGVNYNWLQQLFKPVIASAVMGGGVFVLHGYVLPKLVGETPATIFSVLLGAVVYIVLCILLKALRSDETSQLPSAFSKYSASV